MDRFISIEAAGNELVSILLRACHAVRMSTLPQLAMIPKDKNGNDIMSLSEVGLDGTIRCYRSEGRIRFSEIDVVKVVTGKNNNRAAETIKNLNAEVHEEVTENSVNLQFKGPGQKNTTLITYTGVIKLVMALPGANAKLLRTKFANILMRFFAGDDSLVAEIERNKESTNPINETAREALDEENEAAGDKRKAPDAVEYITKEQLRGYLNEMHNQFKNQRRLTLGDSRRELKIYERKNKSDVEKQQAIAKEVIAMEEAAAKTLQLKIEFAKLEKALSSPPASAPESIKGITICDVATKHKLVADTHILAQAGKLVQKVPYNLVPFDEKGFDLGGDGRVIPVNQYHPLDEEKIVAAIKTAIFDRTEATSKKKTQSNSISKFFTANNETPTASVVEAPGITIHINK